MASGTILPYYHPFKADLIYSPSTRDNISKSVLETDAVTITMNAPRTNYSFLVIRLNSGSSGSTRGDMIVPSMSLGGAEWMAFGLNTAEAIRLTGNITGDATGKLIRFLATTATALYVEAVYGLV